MKYKQLKEPCKSMIAMGKCLGCIKLELPYFETDINCKYSNLPSAEESIKQIKLNLRNGEKMKYRFEIDKRLMGLNEYTKLNRENRYLGNQAKQKEQAYIMWCIKEQLGDLKIDEPVIGHFTWIEENKRRDLDNICFAKKFILDALVQAGVLADDNRKIVTNFTDSFEYADKSKVIVELEEN